MSGGLIDFFILEATEYVDQLDGLVSRATTSAPDTDSFTRAARALRGSATMAKLRGIAEVASGLERLSRAIRDGRLPWDAAIRGTAISAVDDLKFLVRGARTWGESEDKRAALRAAELNRLAPREAQPLSRGGGAAFLATAAADAAAGLLAYAEQPTSVEVFTSTMQRVRALRGVAALKDLPPLSEVVDTLDIAAKPIELRQEPPTAERRRLFRAAARVLIEGGEAVRTGGIPPTDTIAVREFAHAAESVRTGEKETDDVVPIANLLPDGPQSAFVQAAPNPPTSAQQRFRLEVVSQAEHLRRLVFDGRAAVDAATRDRVGRELRSAVRALAKAAQSFAAHDIANLFLAAERGAAILDKKALWVLDEAGTDLSRPDNGLTDVAPRFRALWQRLNGTPPAPLTATIARQRKLSGTPASASVVIGSASGKASGVSGAELQQLLSTGLAGLGALEDSHMSDPIWGEDDDIIPIEDLLYRGKDALRAASDLGAKLRDKAEPPDPVVLNELYDLLQLASAD
ncbi:MAG: hypothetical protein IT357_07305 [Gemmatimonadaceae bacterium]|nr:hypothetical protein [Gemmatimonadaceae bacterium]